MASRWEHGLKVVLNLAVAAATVAAAVFAWQAASVAKDAIKQNAETQASAFAQQRPYFSLQSDLLGNATANGPRGLDYSVMNTGGRAAGNFTVTVLSIDSVQKANLETPGSFEDANEIPAGTPISGHVDFGVTYTTLPIYYVLNVTYSDPGLERTTTQWYYLKHSPVSEDPILYHASVSEAHDLASIVQDAERVFYRAANSG
jgi:hypothetical protein